MRFATARGAALLAVVATMAACTVDDTNTPPLTGPSQLATTLRVTATPANLSFGPNAATPGDQSVISVSAIGADGRNLSNFSVRLSMLINGVPQDFGRLDQRVIVTRADGSPATTVFTAPPAPTNGVITNNCGGSTLGTCMSIVATPDSNNFGTVSPESVQIRLVPPGVILPPAATPTASFQFAPQSIVVNQQVTFDATASCGSPVNSAGVCPNTDAITSYAWNFGDGSSGSGAVVSHAFGNAASYTVTLTVTNDRGGAASTTRPIQVSTSASPSANFTTSPATIQAGDPVFFNGSSSTAAPGRTIRNYEWDFGDGTPHGFGVSVAHAYPSANVYTVTLTVTDDLGQQSSKSGQLNVGTGAPVANFTSSVSNAATHLMTFDGSGSTAAGGATIASYQWAFGDGLSTTPSSSPTVSHAYSAAGTYTVRLTVVDSVGRTGSTSTNVTVP